MTTGQWRPKGRRREAPTVGEQPIHRVVGIVLVALVVAAVLNIDALVRDAEDKPFGASRSVSLSVWEPIQEVVHDLQLHRPRQIADAALGRTSEADTFELPGAMPADVPRAQEAAVPTASTPSVPPSPVRKPTPDAPLDVWFGGDSMSRDPGEAFQRLAADDELFDAALDYRISSGLTRPDFFDWPGHLVDVVGDRDPDVMVIMFGANDAQGIVTPEGEIFQPVEQGWLDEYRRRVAGTMDLLGDDRLVVWLGQPVMRDASFSRKMAALNEIYRNEAESRPWIRYFDTAALLSGPGGAYADFLPRADGGLDDVRQGDGIHLSRAGAGRVADAVFELLRVELDLDPPRSPAARAGA